MTGEYIASTNEVGKLFGFLPGHQANAGIKIRQTQLCGSREHPSCTNEA
jgi:hypothetical protein